MRPDQKETVKDMGWYREHVTEFAGKGGANLMRQFPLCCRVRHRHPWEIDPKFKDAIGIVVGYTLDFKGVLVYEEITAKEPDVWDCEDIDFVSLPENLTWSQALSIITEGERRAGVVSGLN